MVAMPKGCIQVTSHQSLATSLPLRGTFPLRGRLNRCAKPPPSFLIREELSSTIKRGATPYGLPPNFPKGVFP